MKKFIALCFVLLLMGCARFDPRLDEKIDNQNGQIRDIKETQNGIKADIDGIKQSAEITNSKLDHVQNGLVNFQKQNNGVMIFSGSGGVVLGFGFLVCGGIALYYWRQSRLNSKTADLLASRIVEHNNENLLEEVFKSAMLSDVEAKILYFIKKHQQILKDIIVPKN